MYVVKIQQYGSNYELPKQFQTDCLVKTIEMRNGNILNNDMHIAMDILLHEPNLCIIFIDAISAKYWLELLSIQPCIVMLNHETNFNQDISQYNPFNETLCISTGVKFDYFDKEYKDSGNASTMQIINVDNFLATDAYYVELINRFVVQNRKFPSIMLPKRVQAECHGNFKKLENAIKLRSMENVFESVDEDKCKNFIQYAENIDMLVANLHTHGLDKASKPIKQFKI